MPLRSPFRRSSIAPRLVAALMLAAVSATVAAPVAGAAEPGAQALRVQVTGEEFTMTSGVTALHFKIRGVGPSLVRSRFAGMVQAYRDERALCRSAFATTAVLRGYRSLELLVQSETGAEPVQEDLPEAVARGILSYLQEQDQLPTPFDCNSFVHYVNGFGYRFNSLDLVDEWARRPFAEPGEPGGIEPGENVLFIRSPARADEPSLISHVAIFLGHGLYLSKGGDTGGLFVSDFEQMLRAYPSDLTLIITPKR